MQPYISYLICSTARTGSLMLAEALQRTGIAGRPREYFAPKLQQAWSERWGILDTSSYADFLDKAIETGTTPNGVFGAKISGYQLDSFLLKLQQLPNYKERAVSGVFPNLHYIWLIRRDKVRQAVSLWKAKQTNIWREDKEQSPEDQSSLEKTLVFDFEAIDRLRNTILKYEAGWRKFFRASGVEPFRVFYQETALDYQATVLNILSLLGISIPNNLTISTHRLNRQADLLSEEWVRRYRNMKQLPSQSTS